ncbi:MAG: glutamate-1-semialdehyde 2,1-aminomutase [Verrucomicrobia bacterium]|nr:MAG: glutamate-1-semialdehyde 2,1-aminomutase [Verrucomicrobiota bacterium]
MNYQRSHELFATALGLIPGGVNSPVRAFRAVGGEPFFAVRAQGARIWDVDGNEYIDYVGTWGPAIHGHAPAAIIEAIRETAGRGTSFGIPNPLEVEMAQWIVGAVPSVEKVRLCNSGTEAVMSAIRLARGFTKRDKIIKFDGCYHGHVDSLLVRAGSGALTFGYPDSAGVPAAFVQHTVVVPYNDEEAVREALAANRGQVAGIILEPVAGNAGLYAPRPGFLEFLRRITAEEEVVLIFDEVMTGFRLACGGAQELYGIKPDLSCFGKVIGGGLPVGAFGGRREIMDYLAPLGPVYQAGTLSGNPLAMAAGLASLRLLSPQTYQRLDEAGAMLEKGMREIAARAKVPVTFNRVGSMFCGYFTQGPVWNLEDALRSDRARFAKFFHGLLQEGVYLAPSQFEAGFISTAHGSDEIEQTLRAVEKVMATL